MADMARSDDVIANVCALPRNQAVREAATKLGLDVVNVMWEDTARTVGSALGPNITDMTLQVRHSEGSDKRSLLPVFRKPNFRDVTCDVPLDRIKVKVGNQAGMPLQTIPLREYLEKFAAYVSDRGTCHAGNARSLLTDRDTHVLVSAQACLLPIPAGSSGRVEFNPVLMNYQSRRDSPAVMTILLTPEGTSATVLDNTNDKAQWGQNTYHNNNGQKTPLTGQRLSAYREAEAAKISANWGIPLDQARAQVRVASDINVVVVIQVPLVHKPPEPRRVPSYGSFGGGDLGPVTLGGGGRGIKTRGASFEDAAIGRGRDEGKHVELGGYKLERDRRFPIRATVQFYKATDSADIGSDHRANIAACVEKVYSDADFVGSLVDGSLQVGELSMGEARPTQPAPLANPVVAPPADLLDVVNPFAQGNLPKA